MSNKLYADSIHRSLSSTVAPSDIDRISEEYIKTFIRDYDTEDQFLLIEATENSKPIKVIQIDVLAGISLLASLLTGSLGSTDPILICLAVISGLASIKGISKETTKSEAAILWIIYSRREKSFSRTGLQEEYRKLCNKRGDISYRDFNPSLNKLQEMGCIVTENRKLKIVEKVILINK